MALNTVQSINKRKFLRPQLRTFLRMADTVLLHDEETVWLQSRMQIWTVYIRDPTACSVQSDLELHCP